MLTYLRTQCILYLILWLKTTLYLIINAFMLFYKTYSFLVIILKFIFYVCTNHYNCKSQQSQSQRVIAISIHPIQRKISMYFSCWRVDGRNVAYMHVKACQSAAVSCISMRICVHSAVPSASITETPLHPLTPSIPLLCSCPPKINK